MVSLSSNFGIYSSSSSSSSLSSTTGKKVIYGAAIAGIVTATLLVANRKQIASKLKERSVKRMQDFIVQILASASFKTMPEDKFTAFVNALAKLPIENFKKTFIGRPEEAFSILSLNESGKLTSVLKTLSLDKLNFLFRQFSEDKRHLLFNYKTSDGFSFLHIVCRCCNDKSLIDFILSQIPESIREKALSETSTHNISPLIHAVNAHLDQAILSIASYAKANSFFHVLLNQKCQKGANFIQHLCYHGKTKIILAILGLLDKEERRVALSVDIIDSFYQPLVFAVIEKKFDTFSQILQLVPEAIFFTYCGEQNLIHALCQHGMHEAFEYIDAQLLASGLSLEESWKRLLSQKDSINDFNPIQNLAQTKKKSRCDRSISTLKKIQARLSEREYTSLIFNSRLVGYSLANGDFDFSSYLILQYPALINQKHPENNWTIWHYLADPQNRELLLNTERAAFFKRYYSLCQPDLLNEVDSIGQTPLSLAYMSDLEELAECYKQAGAAPMDKMIYSSKVLAHCWSIKGEIPHGSVHCRLEGWSSKPLLKEIFESLKTLSSISSDLLDVFSLFTLPQEATDKAMMERAASNKIWIKPLSLKRHAISIIGSSRLIFLCDTASYSYRRKDGSVVYEVPARIQIFTPTSGFSYSNILALKNNTYLLQDMLVEDLKKFYHLQALGDYSLRGQRADNCTYMSSIGALFAYQGLVKIEENRSEISLETIQTALTAAVPFYKTCQSAIKWQKLKLYRAVANKDLVAAIDSKALVQYAKKIVYQTINSIRSSIQENPKLFPLKPWNELSGAQKDFYIDLSQTQKRQEFLQYLYSLDHSRLNSALANYIREKGLDSLLFLVR